MARLPRLTVAGYAHHVIQRGNNRQVIVRSDTDREFLMELLGENARSKFTDAVATKVLVNGEAMPVPAGRADDFAWPRRTVAPLGADPVVATTDLPMTPMVADRAAAPGSATAAGATAVAAASPVAQKAPVRIRAAEYRQYRPDYRRQQQFNFFPFLFGGGR